MNFLINSQCEVLFFTILPWYPQWLGTHWLFLWRPLVLTVPPWSFAVEGLIAEMILIIIISWFHNVLRMNIFDLLIGTSTGISPEELEIRKLGVWTRKWCKSLALVIIRERLRPNYVYSFFFFYFWYLLFFLFEKYIGLSKFTYLKQVRKKISRRNFGGCQATILRLLSNSRVASQQYNKYIVSFLCYTAPWVKESPKSGKFNNRTF